MSFSGNFGKIIGQFALRGGVCLLQNHHTINFNHLKSRSGGARMLVNNLGGNLSILPKIEIESNF